MEELERREQLREEAFEFSDDGEVGLVVGDGEGDVAHSEDVIVDEVSDLGWKARLPLKGHEDALKHKKGFLAMVALYKQIVLKIFMCPNELLPPFLVKLEVALDDLAVV